MPRGDNTGPAGEGPRTGRGAGYCSGYPYPGYASERPPMRRMSFGRMSGAGRAAGGRGGGYGKGRGAGGRGGRRR